MKLTCPICGFKTADDDPRFAGHWLARHIDSEHSLSGSHWGCFCGASFPTTTQLADHLFAEGLEQHAALYLLNRLTGDDDFDPESAIPF